MVADLPGAGASVCAFVCERTYVCVCEKPPVQLCRCALPAAPAAHYWPVPMPFARHMLCLSGDSSAPHALSSPGLFSILLDCLHFDTCFGTPAAWC